MRKATLSEKFWRYAVRGEGDACWAWTAFVENGYGRLMFGGRCLKAHRVSWELHRGPVPDGLIVCHTCDNRSCSNPNHLFLGTHRDNMQDCIAKGRFIQNRPIGEDHGLSRLTDAQVDEIRKRFVPGTAVSLAEEFGVYRSTIHRIVKRQIRPASTPARAA